MSRPMFREQPRDAGVAMITAVLASLAAVMLGVVAVGFALRSSTQSARNRERVQGVAAADAGIDYYFSHLADATASNVACTLTQTLTTDPPSSFVATATFFDDAGSPITCTPGSGVAATPASVLITSVGGVDGPNVLPERTMEALVSLNPKAGSAAFSPWAVFSDTTLTFNSNSTIIGPGNTADVYARGAITLDSNSVLGGSVYGASTISLNSKGEIKKDVHSTGALTMDSNAVVRGNATSGNANITMNGNAHVYGSGRACTTITLNSNAAIDGTQTPNSCAGPPNPQTFPALVFNRAAWESAGYTVKEYTSCTDARTFVNQVSSGTQPAGDYVVKINAKCTYTPTTDVNVRGNLAIVSNGAVFFSSNTRFVPTNGPPHDVFFILGQTSGTPCDYTMDSNSRIMPGLKTFVHTPCTISLSSNTSVAEGQFFGGTVTFNSNSNFTAFSAVTVPGTGSPGWNADVSYRREVP